MSDEWFASANVKGRGMPRPRHRIRHMVDTLTDAGASVVGLQEVTPRMLAAVDERPWARVIQATPNTVDGKANVVRVGNGLVVDRRVRAVLDIDEIAIHVYGHGLHLPVVLTKHRTSHRRTVFVVYHAPAGFKPAAEAARLHCEQTVLAYLSNRRVARTSAGDHLLDVVVLGDANRTEAFPGWYGGRHRIDLAVSDTLPLTGSQVFPFVDLGWSDHDAVSTRNDGPSSATDDRAERLVSAIPGTARELRHGVRRTDRASAVPR